MNKLVLNRFWDKVEITNSCWNWSGGKNKAGYGRISINHVMVLAHRFIYEIMESKIPRGIVIDHLCRNRSCVNPSHMDITTIGQNCMRGDSPSAINSRKTHCGKGHQYNDNNMRIDPKTKKKRCIICQKEYDRIRWKTRR